MKYPPPLSSKNTDLTSNQLLENIVSLGLETEGLKQNVASVDVNLLSADTLSQCASSQLTEGRCSIVASGASSLEPIAVEKDETMSSSSLGNIMVAKATVMSNSNVYLLVIFGTVTVGLVALVSIVALALDGNVSLKSETSSDSHLLEFEVNHQPNTDTRPFESPPSNQQDLIK